MSITHSNLLMALIHTTTRSLVDHRDMFDNLDAEFFNGDISSWNVANVRNMK